MGVGGVNFLSKGAEEGEGVDAPRHVADGSFSRGGRGGEEATALLEEEIAEAAKREVVVGTSVERPRFAHLRLRDADRGIAAVAEDDIESRILCANFVIDVAHQEIMFANVVVGGGSQGDSRISAFLVVEAEAVTAVVEEDDVVGARAEVAKGFSNGLTGVVIAHDVVVFELDTERLRNAFQLTSEVVIVAFARGADVIHIGVDDGDKVHRNAVSGGRCGGRVVALVAALVIVAVVGVVARPIVVIVSVVIVVLIATIV